MKTYKLFALVSFLMIVLISCTKIENTSQEENPIKYFSQLQEKKINEGDFTLSSDDAIKVALLAGVNGTQTKSLTDLTVKEVVTIKGLNNHPAMYAVNFNNNRGFTLVSASKKYYPILATVEKGEFGPDCYNTGIAVLLEEYKQGIEYAKLLPEDSLVAFRLMWKQYEKSEKVMPITKSDIMTLVSQSTSQWSSEGIEYFSLSETGGVPPWNMSWSLYTQFYEMVQTYGNQSYDPEIYSFFLYGYINDVVDEVDQLMETEWAQTNGFNAALTPLEGGILPPAGCVAVAMAQDKNSFFIFAA